MTSQRLLHLALLVTLAGGAGCGGGGGGASPGSPAPTGLSYTLDPVGYRAGEAIAPNVASLASGTATSYSVDPALPAGLTLDTTTGAITGTPLGEAAVQTYTVTATGDGGQTSVGLDLLVGPALPAEVASLAAGFGIERIATGLALPTKFALAPDGRVFFSELKSGNVRVIDANGALLPTPWATVTVQGAGSHQGLLALALSPTFDTDGHVFLLYSAPADATHAADHLRLERFTDVLGAGTNQTVILDDLPAATTNNGADIVFDLTRNLVLSLGDANVADNAQDPLVYPGKLLRLTPTGLVPGDNPDPTSLVLCLGLRNTYGLAVHPLTGGIFGVDNGPAQDDELNYYVGGRNYGWGAVAPIPGNQVGLRIQVWPTEIVPTAVVWHHGTGFGPDAADDLYLASYDDERVRRFEMSGSARTDIDAESVFLTFSSNMTDHKPLDLVVAPDGALWVSTFTSIYRIAPLL